MLMFPSPTRRRVLAIAVLLACPSLAVVASPVPQLLTPSASNGPTATDNPQQLAPVTVEADATSAPPVTGTEVHINAAAIARHNVTEVEDVLAYAPNLTIRKRYIGDTNAILGGRAAGTLQSARSLVYANGLLLSDLLGSGWSNPPRWGMVSARDISAIDVLYGPFSALYPGNSLGTTVQLHTRLPDKLEASATVQAFSQHFRDNWGTDQWLGGQGVDASLGNRHGRWHWRLSASYLANHGQPMGYASARAGGDPIAAVTIPGIQPDRKPDGHERLLLGPTGMDDTRQSRATLDVGLDLNTNMQARFTLGLWHNRSDQHARSRLRDNNGQLVTSGSILVDGKVWTIPASAFAPSSADDTQRLLGLHLQGHSDSDWHWQVDVSRYDYLAARQREAASLDTPAGSIADNAGSGWQTLDLRSQGPLGDQHTLQVGVHWDRYVLDSKVHATNDWREGSSGVLQKAYGGRTTTSALYVQDLWKLAPDWLLTLGLRGEHWRASHGLLANAGTRLSYPSRSESALSPKAALAWYFADDWQVRLSLGHAVRFPTVGELFQGSISGHAIVHNDPNLKPEEAWASDLSLERHSAYGHWRISLFDYRIRDTLYRQTDITVTPSVTRVGNIDRVRMRGIELAGQWHDVGVTGLNLYASVAWNDADTLRDTAYPLADGKTFPRIPRVRAKAGASWKFAPTWEAGLDIRHSGRQYGSLDNTDHIDTFGAVSNFTVVDAKFTWHPAPAWTAALGINNLTDRHYWVYHPWPGRTFFASLGWKLP